jgi:hypothetical protein
MAVAFDASTAGSNAGGTSLTFSHTASGSDRAVVVAVVTNDYGGGITGVTYGGASMTEIGTGRTDAKLYGLVAPATGAQNVVCSGGAGMDFWQAAASSFTGVDQATPFSGATQSTTSTANPSISVTSETDARVVGMIMASGGGTITFDSPTTAREDGSTFGTGYMLGDRAGAASATVAGNHADGAPPGWQIILGVSVDPVGIVLDTLTIDSQPSTATSGAPMGNVVISSSDTASTATVTATIASGSGSLSGTTSGAMVAGEITFSNLIITGTGAHTLAFNAADHDEVVSSTITVSDPSAPPRVLISFRPPA